MKKIKTHIPYAIPIVAIGLVIYFGYIYFKPLTAILAYKWNEFSDTTKTAAAVQSIDTTKITYNYATVETPKVETVVMPVIKEHKFKGIKTNLHQNMYQLVKMQIDFENELNSMSAGLGLCKKKLKLGF